MNPNSFYVFILHSKVFRVNAKMNTSEMLASASSENESLYVTAGLGTLDSGWDLVTISYLVMSISTFT